MSAKRKARGRPASLGTVVGQQPFVPGLYRMLASWPAFLAHVATVLRPHLHDAATRAACQRLLDAVDAEIPAVFAALETLTLAGRLEQLYGRLNGKAVAMVVRAGPRRRRKR